MNVRKIHTIVLTHAPILHQTTPVHVDLAIVWEVTDTDVMVSTKLPFPYKNDKPCGHLVTKVVTSRCIPVCHNLVPCDSLVTRLLQPSNKVVINL